MEDKIVKAVLTPIYEAEFLGFSYGFRAGRNLHQIPDALAYGIGRKRINWMLLDYDVHSNYRPDVLRNKAFPFEAFR